MINICLLNKNMCYVFYKVINYHDICSLLLDNKKLFVLEK